MRIDKGKNQGIALNNRLSQGRVEIMKHEQAL